MSRQGGFGAKVKIDISGTMTAIVHAKEITFPELEKILADITAHDSPGGYAEWMDTNKRKMNEFALKIGWDADEATHAALLAAYAATVPATFSVSNPDDTEVLVFDGWVRKVGRAVEQEDEYTCEITIQPTGIPALGSGSGYTGSGS